MVGSAAIQVAPLLQSAAKSLKAITHGEGERIHSGNSYLQGPLDERHAAGTVFPPGKDCSAVLLSVVMEWGGRSGLMLIGRLVELGVLGRRSGGLETGLIVGTGVEQVVVIDARSHLLGRLAAVVAKQLLWGYEVVSESNTTNELSETLQNWMGMQRE